MEPSHDAIMAGLWPAGPIASAISSKAVKSSHVDNSVEISLDGVIVKTHPIRQDRAKEFGAFSAPNGRPRNKKASAAS
jgi:hypothetical protein